MSEVRALIEQLVAAGVDPVDAAEVVSRAAIYGAANAPRPQTPGAIRQERYRRNKASQVTVGDVSDAPKEKVAPKEITPKENPPKGGQKKSARVILESVLSADDTTAVLEHRQALKKPLTARAAEMLAAQLEAAPAACGLSPQQAANLMIAKGWTGFEAAWALNAKASLPPQKPPDNEETWAKRLRFARERKTWASADWGPKPGQSGCLVPKQLLEQNDGNEWTEWERAA